MSYQKIFVALDQSELAAEVFSQALAMAKSSQAKLMLFHAIPLDNQSFSTYPSFYGEDITGFSEAVQKHLEKEQADTQLWLKRYAEQARAEGITCEWDWKVGDAGHWIREVAKHGEADLVVIGRRGLRGMAEFFLGSVSNYVTHHVPCSVLIVQASQASQ